LLLFEFVRVLVTLTFLLSSSSSNSSSHLCWELRHFRALSHVFIRSISVMKRQSELTFSFCECFSRKNIISAGKWFRKLKHELSLFKVNEKISSERYINSVNLLLIKNAAEWFETNSYAARLLIEKELTANTLTAFKSRFQEKFSAKIVNSTSHSVDTAKWNSTEIRWIHYLVLQKILNTYVTSRSEKSFLDENRNTIFIKINNFRRSNKDICSRIVKWWCSKENY
jgi:hypothetical protein